MTTKSATWRPGATVCRCCLAEGCYKDIATEYFWMGKREVYSEMLNDTFDVSIAYSQAGGPNSNSRLICEPCISRLRDASEFKRQVQECEKTFMQYLEPGSSATTEVNASVDSEKDVKLEDVKQEKEESDEDYGLPDDFPDDDGDDDDDIDDQPLTKLASKIPKKEEEAVDLLDFLDPPKVAEKRKSAAKAKSSPAKKAKTTEAKASVSKVKSPPEKKKKDYKETSVPRQNAVAIVKYTTACPSRLYGDITSCVFCFDTFTDPAEYRKHFYADHKTFNPKMAFANFNSTHLRIDCTDLRCRLCDASFKVLDAIVQHLREAHGLGISLDGGVALLPHKFEDDKLLCVFCDTNLPGFRQLSKHISTHYRTHICETCGKSFMTRPGLLLHLKYTHSGMKYPCVGCKMNFESNKARKEHVTNSEECWMYVCKLCKKRFVTWKLKQQHSVDVHKKPVKTYPCTECDEVFSTQQRYYQHFKVLHSVESHICSYCSQKFHSEVRLNNHMVSHTKERKFKCSKCSKTYPRKCGLRRHWLLNHEQ